MRHLRFVRALLGGAGLAGCIGLLAGQARADIVEFVPVQPVHRAAGTAKAPRVASVVPAALALLAKPSLDKSGRPRADCAAPRLAMAPAQVRAPH
jgi:hypothetical protein